MSAEEHRTFPRVSTEQGEDEVGIQDELGDYNAPPYVVLEARLTKCQHQQSLYDLWKDCEFGFCGYKPARIGQLQRGVKTILNITREMFSGSSFRDGEGGAHSENGYRFDLSFIWG